MTVEVTDIDCSLCLNLEEWLKNSVVQELQRTLEEKILRFLFSQSHDDPQFLQIVEQLAWIGSTENTKPLLAREIVELHAEVENSILHCGFGKSLMKTASRVGRFVAEHKTAILAGAGLCATGIGLAAALGYSLTVSAGGVVLAGAGSLFDSKGKHKPDPKIPNMSLPRSKAEIAAAQQPIPSSVPKIDLPSTPNELLVTTHGIWANDRYYPTSELTKASIIAQEISKYPSPTPNYNGDFSNPYGTHNPFLPPLPDYMANATVFPELKKPCFSTETIPSRTSKDEKEGFLPDQWNDFDAPSKYAPNSRHPITGNLSYNEHRSRKFTIFGNENSDLHIGWINGISNSFEESKENATYLQKLTGGYTVCGIYNCSHTAPLDILEAGFLNYPGFSPNTAKLLQNNWEAFHEANRDQPNAKLLQVCHSQGAIHVRNALENSPEEIRDRLMVLAIAPAAIVPDRLCFKSFNYASNKDIIYKFEPSPPPDRPHKLDGVILPIFGKAINDSGELIILKAHSEAKGIDHEFQSLTYRDVIAKILEDFEQHKGEYPPK